MGIHLFPRVASAEQIPPSLSRLLGLHLLGLALLLGIGFCAHLGGDWVWDDIHLIANNPNLSGWAGLGHVWTHDLWGGAGLGPTELYHPIPMTAVWAGHALWGRSLVAFRIANVVLHASNSLLFAVWLRRRGISPTVSVWAALLVAVHPMVTEPVMWITGSHDLLATAGCLVALIVWPANGDRRVAWRIGLASLATLWAVLCKEPYVVLPAILAGLLVYADADTARTRATRMAWLAAPAGSLAVMLGLRVVVDVPTGSAQLGASMASHVITYATIVRHYLGHLLTFDNAPTTDVFRPLPALAAAATVAVLVAVFLVLAFAWRRRMPGTKLALVGWLWFLVALLPHTIATPTIGMYGNRYAYFPMLGLATMLVSLVAPHAHRLSAPPWRAAGYLLPAVALLMAGVVSTQSSLWQDEVTLFGADVNRDPSNSKAVSHYGTALVSRSGCPAALPFLAKAVRYDSSDAKAWHNITGCLVNAQRFAEALGPATMAEKLQPLDAGAAYNLGVVDLALGRRSEGVRLLQKALRLRPNHENARKVLADVRTADGAAPSAP